KRIDPRSPERLDRANVYDLQPQMWAFEGSDKHRAITLLQARADSLKHASMRTFLRRGLTWVAGRDDTDAFCAKEDLATLRYPQGGPRTAADTVKSFDLSPGFTASPVASEPLINKAIAMQWDARGRLWVAETPEYPNGRRPAIAEPWRETGVLKPGKYDRPATDRISILTDSDGDGVMDKKTVFYEGLELVTGFCLYGDGVIAVGQPDIVFLHDTNGDDKADREERLFTGFTPGDTHFVANHFMVSPDGWIYANTGSGADAVSVVNPAVRGKVSPGIFRFKPDGSAIGQVGSKGGNAFGMDITSDLELFCGQATSGSPVQHMVIPESVLARGKVGNTGSVESVIRNRKVIRADMPQRAPFMQIDLVGSYSSACASTVQEGGAWPAEWENGVFCTEPILDIIHFEKLIPDGPSFTGRMIRTDREWLRAGDFWFFPIDIQFGPDGAMYVLDFYNPVVAHSDSRGPQHSRSGATTRPDRDHYFGRIYRIQHEEAKKLAVPDLSKASAGELVATFGNPGKRTRFLAQQLLMSRSDAASTLPALTALAEGGTFAPSRILALWSLHRLGKLTPATLSTALKASDAGVRKNALLVIEAMGPQNTVDFSALVRDADPRVRLAALRAMSTGSLSPQSAAALLAAMPGFSDNWSRSAAVAAASSNPTPVLEAALASQTVPSTPLLELASSLASTLTDRMDSTALATLFEAAAKAPQESTPLTRAILNAAAMKPPPAPEGGKGEAALLTLLNSDDAVLAAGALPVAAAWAKEASLKRAVASRIDAFLSLTTDAGQPEPLRAAALHALARAHTADARILPALTALLAANPGENLSLSLIAALSATNDKTLGAPLAGMLPALSQVAQNALFDVLARRAEWAGAVLDALESGTLKPALLGPSRLSKLRLHPDKAVSSRALKLIDELGGGTNPQKNEIIAKLLPLIEAKPGDAAKGKLIYSTTCAICHKLNGEGKEVGPPLDGIGVHSAAELLVSIIDPGRVVDNEHRTWSLTLKDGTFAVGIIARESENSMTLRLPGGIEQEIKVADIKSRVDTGLSLMPEGFEALGAETMADILAYLSEGSGKYRALNLARAFTTDTGAGLYQARENRNDSIPPVKYGIVTVQGIPFSLPDPATTPTGGNVIVLKNGDGPTFAGTLPQRVEIPVGFAASRLHFLGGVAGWGGGPGTVRPAMKVTVEHTNGAKEVTELKTGEVFIDYVSGEDVPGSRRVDGVVKRHHVRYFALPVKQPAPVKSVILESYNNGISPTTLAITADLQP
ncbi:MAG TPA: PVC-type heme-binding CxxCH protein, partial [Verrucomicrobiales bacterium]|nr:PVC-type heme-binding CxxCH protein [Verrucomicrobiales bacterium]